MEGVEEELFKKGKTKSDVTASLESRAAVRKVKRRHPRKNKVRMMILLLEPGGGL